MTLEAENIRLADWPVAILAGGLAQRMRPITETIPKALVAVAGEPFLAHQLRLLYGAGFRHVVICAGYLGEMIESTFGTGAGLGLQIEYCFDWPRLLGTGGALRQALPVLGERFFVLYGDSYLPIDYRQAALTFTTCNKAALMTVFRNEGRWDTSNVRFEAGRILAYDKNHPTPEMRYIDYGLGIFRSEVFDLWPAQQPFDLAEVYRRLLVENQLCGYEVSQRFYEIGSPEGLAELDAFLQQQPAIIRS